MRRWCVRLEFKLADLWVGIFWKVTRCRTDDGDRPLATDVWICLLPCIPIHITCWHPVVIPFSPPD